MKTITPNPIRVGTFLAMMLAILLPVPSQAETNKIGIIDAPRVFENYWKTKQAQAQVDDQTTEFEKRKKGMLDDYQKADREYKKLYESAQDQAVSSDERDRRKSAARIASRSSSEAETIGSRTFASITPRSSSAVFTGMGLAVTVIAS